jgi:hypothetical protein
LHGNRPEAMVLSSIRWDHCNMKSVAQTAAPASPEVSDEDEDYLSIFWGILRRPIACTSCGALTRTPSYSGGTVPICGTCFRISIFGH